ncbi:UpxY family transcription antiterminator [Subsaximicrobium wynnwilliamsii]|uniref:UpxY family transcription antiterminator n=1 Tax=Subsaximicrobium wynnwilliamsii TaxID=291179 RepID=A0A5C6ZG33_9FLAO|nr:UpxY family transcription antiterminator [Subsaximicrobium wynnwilliamsii]TXD81352.1 UpxY family transcription antiterminator [Subsaximicrobium wynnwilliamsii]TXD89048.1 UpxY family transcription antiterminator [Subsaximicrobium wynnwilliamsii]TXE00726.1 UpxY family transcription antiterminator [Subsaximicrobium wynnwilliamsii]
MQQLNWYVIITKPRSERKVADRLSAIGIDVYCPIKTEMRQWSDRKKKVEVPVLPSMVLVKLADKDRNRVFEVTGVVRYLFWLGEPAVVREEEIDVLKKAMDSGLNIVEVDTIKVGDMIEIEGLGSVKKEKGKVKYVSGNRCWVVLESLGYVVTLDI